MTPNPVVPRGLANRDVDGAIAWYQNEDAEQAALDFISALKRAYGHIGSHPASGPGRYAHEPKLPGQPSWPLAKFPYLVFYVENADRVDVWRVLHGERDIPARVMDAGVD